MDSEIRYEIVDLEPMPQEREAAEKAEQALTQAVADLELEIQVLVRRFEKKNGVRVDHIGTSSRSTPLGGYDPTAEYYSRYTNHISVNIVPPETEVEYRRAAKERQAEKERQEREAEQRKVEAEAEAALQALTGGASIEIAEEVITNYGREK